MEKREYGDLRGGANGVVFSLPGHGTTVHTEVQMTRS